jgi:hypothetical protein
MSGLAATFRAVSLHTPGPMKRWRLTTSLLALGALAACSELSDLGPERERAPDAATGGAVGSGATSGTSAGGSSATGGAGGTGASGGSAGSAGESGTSGAAGSSDASADVASDACGANLMEDSAHCGACGHDCQGGGCVNGACQAVTLTSPAIGPFGVAAGSAAIFWTNQQNGDFSRMLKNDSTPQTWSAFGGPTQIAASGGWIYFVSPARGLIYRASEDGLQAPTSHFDPPQALDSVWADDSGVYYDGPDGLRRYAGSQEEVLAAATARPEVIRTDTDHAYFTTIDAGAVYRCPKAGTLLALTPLYSAGTFTRALAVDAEYVYFGAWGTTSSEVLRGKKDGSSVTLDTIASGQSNTVSMVRAGPYLYWVNAGTVAANNEDGSVIRARVEGVAGAPFELQTVASGLHFPRSSAADATAVYVVARGTPPSGPGTISRIVW